MARNFLSDFVGGVSRASDQLPGAARTRLGFQRQDEKMAFQREQAELDESFREKQYEANESWRERTGDVEDWKNQHRIYNDKANRIRTKLTSAMTLTGPEALSVIEGLEHELDIVTRQMAALSYPQDLPLTDEGTTTASPPGEIIDPGTPKEFLPDTTAPGPAVHSPFAPAATDPVAPSFLGGSSSALPPKKPKFYAALYNQKQRDLQNAQYKKLLQEEAKLLREGETTVKESFDRIQANWRENGEPVPIPGRYLEPTDLPRPDGKGYLTQIERDLSVMYRQKWPVEFKKRLDEVTDLILKGEINEDAAMSAITRSALDQGVTMTEKDVVEFRDSFLTSKYKLEWTPQQDKTRSQALEVQMGIATTLERLQHKEVWTQMGAIKGRFARISLWVKAAKSNLNLDGEQVDASDSKVVIDHELEGFLTSLGLNRDQIVRMRTGAAVNAAEDVLFKAIWGNELDSPEQLQAKLRAGYQAMQHARASVWKTALLKKYHNKTAEEIDELMEGIPIHEGLDVEFNEDLHREMNKLEERFKMDKVNPPDPEDKKRHLEIIGKLVDRGFINLPEAPPAPPPAPPQETNGVDLNTEDLPAAALTNAAVVEIETPANPLTGVATLETGVSSRWGKNPDHKIFIDFYAKKHEVDPDLVSAIIQAESSGDPNAKSKKGAVGLMQLMPVHNVEDRRDPEQNIAAGTRYLRELINEFGSIEDALWAYNAGPTAAREGRKPRETAAYIDSVMGFLNDLKGGGIQ